MDSGILPSRQELLSRIELVCDLNSSFIAVTGEAGIGKSALLEFFVEHHCAASKKCFISVQPEQPDYHLKGQILSQLLSREKYDPHAPLLDNFSLIDPQDAFGAIIIFDNAQYIDNELFDELIAVLKSSHLAIELSVIFAQSRNSQRVGELNSRFPLIEFHLEPLSDEESRLLLKLYFRTAMGSDPAYLQQFIQDSQGLPEKLLQFTAPDEQQPAESVKLSKQTLVMIAAGLLLLSVVGVASWYFITHAPEPQTVVVNEELVDSPERGNSPEPDPSKKPTDSELLAAVEAMKQLADKGLKAPETEPETAPEDKSEEAPADGLDGLLVQRWDDGAKPVEAQIVEENKQTSETAEPETAEPETAEPVTAEPETAEPVTAESVTAEPVLINEMDNQWFLNQDGRLLVIQLTGVSDLDILDTYLTEHRLKATAHIYQSIRGGKPWYVVTLGAYTSHQLATEGIAALSAPLQATSPWVKSVSTIQLEIVNANKSN